MPDKPVAVEGPQSPVTGATSGERTLTLDPIREYVLRVPAREVETTIPAGFQQMWGDGDTPGGEPFELFVGAGFGSGWGTFRYRGRHFAFRAADVVAALVEAIDGEEGQK